MKKLLAGAAAAVLAFAALGSLALAGGGCVPVDAAHTKDSGTAIAIKGCKFSPVVLSAPLGATVTWTHREDHPPHNIYGLGWGMSPGRMLEPGAAFTATFDKPGIYPYQCSLHPGMSGVVIVGDGQPAAAAAPQESPLVAGRAASSGDAPFLAVLAGLGLVASSLIAYRFGRRARTAS
jgi:plastocyanin